MQANRRRDTGPERRLRQALFARGMRFRVDYKVTGATRAVRVDIAFTRRKLAIFVDGCFWHSCPKHGNRPRSSSDYWAAKLDGNRVRDSEVDANLGSLGWVVIRVWEHEVSTSVAERIQELLHSSGAEEPGH